MTASQKCKQPYDNYARRAGAGRVRYECAGASERGITRRQNQDRYRISETGVVVCDGIGGADAGEVFAEASCWSCDKLLDTSLEADEIIMRAGDTAAAVGEALASEGGCSAVVAKFHEDGTVDISSRGDVLALRISGDKTSVINAPDYSPKEKLTAYLGDGRSHSIPSERHCALPLNQQDECFVFMSDGVWKSLSRNEILCLWNSAQGDIDVMAQSLVTLAGTYGSLDDRTAVVCKRVE